MTSDHLPDNETIISVILVAGSGSQMNGYNGNKALLPLEPRNTIYNGTRPIIEHILEKLPDGAKILVINHCMEDIIAATCRWGACYCKQPELNGTGGALLAAAEQLRQQPGNTVIITMGDVPFIRQSTYRRLVGQLSTHDMVVLGFIPSDKRQYGLLFIENNRVKKIIEWKFWKDYSQETRHGLAICNAGIYAFRKDVLERYFTVLTNRPQIVHKMIDGELRPIQEFFLTDLVEFMTIDSRSVGYVLCQDENEPMGIDDPMSLERAQRYYSNIEKCCPGAK